MNKAPKLIIGREELINLPGLGLEKIAAKVDTGAYTSALHVHNIELKKVNGEEVLFFNLLDPSHPRYEEKTLRAKVIKKKKIKNSFGHCEERYIIKMPISIYDRSIEVEFSLTNRCEMKYPVLLGRKLLKQGRFIVDVSRRNLGHKAIRIPN